MPLMVETNYKCKTCLKKGLGKEMIKFPITMGHCKYGDLIELDKDGKEKLNSNSSSDELISLCTMVSTNII